MVHPIITIFVIEDDLTFAKLIQASLEERNNNVNIVHYEDAEACLENIHQNPDLITIDHSLPGISGLELLKKVKDYNSNIKTVFISAQDQVNVVIEAFGTGADAYIEKGDNCIPLLVKNFENLISNISQKHEIENLREELISQHKYEEIKGNSPEILKVHAAIDKAIRSNMVIIITGESGTGKELVARAVHFNSDRKNKTFVAENMAAIPKELIESELFGHEKGSFTGADSKRIGKFEEADGGSLFLDEIGEMDFDLQSKLLRVLETKKIVRVGSNNEVAVDVRVIAATNKNLADEVKAGNFRKDLFYRLQGFIIDLPPLRERGDDILLLANEFLKACAKDNELGDLRFEKATTKLLLNHSWHGNVRELKTTVERSAWLAQDNLIKADDILFTEDVGF